MIQLVIAFTGALAIVLNMHKVLHWRRIGCVFGLIGQPFWIIASYEASQWGILALSFLYTAVWLYGFIKI